MHEENNKSMTIPIVSVVLIIVIGVVIFIIASNNLNNSLTSSSNNPVSSSVNTRTFTLESEDETKQSGTVVFTEVGDSTKVTINLTNAISDSEAAHIHSGKCPLVGTVKYPLTNVINGSSVTTINVKFSDLKSLGELAVNVHKHIDQVNNYVACGNLAF